MSDRKFKQKFRVTKELFEHILDRINNHAVFKNNSRNKQRSPRLQLAVALHRLGVHGNGGSKGNVSEYFEVGDGTALLYTERVIEALLSLEDEVIVWPDANERAEHAEFMDIKYGFKGCVGVVDGSCCVLETRPAVSGSDYFCRHKQYGVNVTVVVDHSRLIRYMIVGWPASRHDNFIFEQTGLYDQPREFFSPFEYLLGDTAYTLSNHCMCPYKLPSANDPDNALFNYHLSKARVCVEHTFGIVKNRFMSLKGMPIQAKKESDFVRVNKWIKACCILHNIAIKFGCNDFDTFDGADEHEDRDEDDEHIASGSGRTFREKLKIYIKGRFV
jgi:hypothetical protein